MHIYPLLCKPVYKEMLWGGNNLSTLYHKEIPSHTTGESWELTLRENEVSIIENGPLEGKPLKDVIDDAPLEYLGSKLNPHNPFPLLIKFIDAKDDLSVQVHPDDEYGLAHENDLGKSEAWYILHAEPGAQLVYGLQPGVTKASFQQAIKNNTLDTQLQYVSVEAGDLLYIPSGTVHAIGKGIIICEVQQNSNTTYRVYDYNRKDANGNTRPLHIDKALDVINFDEPVSLNLKQTLVDCEYFTLEIKNLINGKTIRNTDDIFEVFVALEGTLSLEFQGKSINTLPGQTYFIPATLGEYSVTGTGKYLLSIPK